MSGPPGCPCDECLPGWGQRSRSVSSVPPALTGACVCRLEAPPAPEGRFPGWREGWGRQEQRPPRGELLKLCLLSQRLGMERLFRNSLEPHPCDVKLPQRPPRVPLAHPCQAAGHGGRGARGGADASAVPPAAGERGCSPCSPPLTPALAPQLGSSWGAATSALSPQAGPLPSVRPARGPCALVQTTQAPHILLLHPQGPLLWGGDTLLRAVQNGAQGLSLQACRPSCCLRETASLRFLPTLPADFPRRS